MYPILFSFGQINIYNHGLMMVLGSIAGGFFLYHLATREKLKTNFILDLVVYSVFGGIIGARLAYFIVYFNQFNSWQEIFYLWNGGMISFGGMIGGLLFAWLILSLRKEKVLPWMDIGFIGLMLGWAIGRVGCFLNGDSVGLATNSFLGFYGRWPTQLYESSWSLIVVAFGYYLIGKRKAWKLPEGSVFLIAAASYALGRFLIDNLREEEFVLGLIKPGQLASLIIFIIALIGIIVLFKKAKMVISKEVK